MRVFRRQTWLSLLIMIIALTPLGVMAQDDALRIDGSRIVADIVAPVVEALDVPASVEISGTSNGLASLCSGEADMAMAARGITREEAAACESAGIEWVEIPVAYDALAIVKNPAIATAQCMTFTELTDLFGPGATATVSTLNQVNPAWGPVSIQVYALAADSPAMTLLDSLLPGDGVRVDVTTEADAEAVLTAVAEDVAGIGIVPLSALLQSDAEVTPVALNDLSGAGCVEPSLETLASNAYPAANGLYVYTSTAALEREATVELLTELVGEQGQTVAADAGFVTLSAETAARASDNITGKVTGRQFSEPEPLYTIDLDVAGTVQVESGADAFTAIKTLTDGLRASYPGLSVNLHGFGNAVAYENLCAGTADAAVVTRSATADELAACEANNIALWDAQLGARALVLVVGKDADYAACLTTDQVADLWKAEQGQTVTNWSELGEDFPALPVTVFLPTNSQNVTDLILTSVSDTLYDSRRDALQQRNDPLWRAAATANVEGAITYMTLEEFEASEADVMTVAIDAGEGCVAPTTETILNGSYAISKPIMLVVRQDALARPEVQALTWYAVHNSADDLRQAAITPVSEDAFTRYQEELVSAFAEAETAAEATAEDAADSAPAVPAATEESGN
ncbi:MAG: PstS family phosphate ABC transporter substrate-binding protein [Anaerolineae bacterium]